MSLKGILGGIDVDVILNSIYSTDQSPPGLLGTYKRLDGVKGFVQPQNTREAWVTTQFQMGV